jgi:hypothetical protein
MRSRTYRFNAAQTVGEILVPRPHRSGPQLMCFHGHRNACFALSTMNRGRCALQKPTKDTKNIPLPRLAERQLTGVFEIRQLARPSVHRRRELPSSPIKKTWRVFVTGGNEGHEESFAWRTKLSFTFCSNPLPTCLLFPREFEKANDESAHSSLPSRTSVTSLGVTPLFLCAHARPGARDDVLGEAAPCAMNRGVWCSGCRRLLRIFD